MSCAGCHGDLHDGHSLPPTPRCMHMCRTFNWVRNEAPVIIHLNLSTVLEHLVHDTHYRNLFEVGEGGGTMHLPTRARWEVRVEAQTGVLGWHGGEGEG